MANRGDTLPIVLDYTINGIPIEDWDLDEIEFSLGSRQYTLSHEDITLDDILNKYVLNIGQATTLKLGANTRYQVRFKKDGEVTSSDIGFIKIGASLSTKTI
jgi:hypothetical protein